jgi:hypothetical protein
VEILCQSSLTEVQAERRKAMAEVGDFVSIIATILAQFADQGRRPDGATGSPGIPIEPGMPLARSSS